jgi:hypothetical protein
MKIQTDGCMRHELKFLLPRTCMDELRPEVRRHTVLDPFCTRIPGSRYVVRSIYLDTADFEFYFEKIDGVKVRKKLRIRTYDSPEPGGPAFIEIKRKMGRCGLKERLQLPLARVDHALNGKNPDRVLPDPTFRNRKVLGKIRYLMHVKDLRPVVLVTYEREAYVGSDDARQRVTFDSNIRSLVNPTLEQIGEECGLKQFEDTHFVLELKYDGSMPGWMVRLIRDFDLERGPYSKYCNGLDAWHAVAIG